MAFGDKTRRSVVSDIFIILGVFYGLKEREMQQFSFILQYSLSSLIVLFS